MDLDPERLSGSWIVSVDGSDPAAEVFDMLRTRVYRRLQQNKWTSVAVVSPPAGCGSSLVATNLAFGLARQDDCRVLLVDLNLRQPQLAALMGIDNPFALEQTLQNEAPLDASVLRCGSNLALLAYNGAVKHPAELLQSIRIAEALTTLRQRLAPDVILCDMAPLRPQDDSLAFLPQADCALLVLEAEKTTAEQADLCAFEITQATSMLGVVLNKCRFPADPLLVGGKA